MVVTITVPDIEVDIDASATVENVEAFWSRRLERLTNVWQGARAERCIAMYQLHQLHLPVNEIARLADETVGTVTNILAIAVRDPDMAEYSERPLWNELWPTW
jgi:hypothetical protein